MKREKWKSKKLINYSFVSSEFKCKIWCTVSYCKICEIIWKRGKQEMLHAMQDKLFYFQATIYVYAFESWAQGEKYCMGKVTINLSSSSSDILILNNS